MQRKAQKTIKFWHFGCRTAMMYHSQLWKEMAFWWIYDTWNCVLNDYGDIYVCLLNKLNNFFSKQFWILGPNKFDQPYDFTMTCCKDWVENIRNPAGAGNKIAGKLMLDQLYLFFLVFKRAVTVSSKTAFQAVQWVQFQVQGIKLQNYCSKATKYRNMFKKK